MNKEAEKLAKRCFSDMAKASGVVMATPLEIEDFYAKAFNAGVEAAANRLDAFQHTEHHQAAIRSLKVKT